MNDVPAQTTNELPQTNPTLKELAARANDAHCRVRKAAGEGLLAAFEAGHALLQARKACVGQWFIWLAANFKGSTRTAERYMEFAAECHSLGGFDATRASRLPTQELGRVWSQILGHRAGKKKRQLTAASGARESGKQVADDVKPPTADTMKQVPAVQRAATPAGERGGSLADPMPPLVVQFADLIEGFRRVCAGDDCHDGPYAESMVMDLEPQYADLIEYMEYRKEWRSEPGDRGVCKS